MNVTEVLQLVDQLVFKHTGNHLNDLQKNAILGIWQGQTYSEIASNFGYDSENYIGKISRQLYEILSKELGEDVTKSNFCWSIERIANSFNPQFIGIGIKNHVNWCNNNSTYSTELINNKNINNHNQTYLDLKQAPRITKLYGRDQELSILSKCLEDTNTNLISVVGIAGIGKTVLVRKVIDVISKNFDIIIWKNLKLYQSFNEIIREIETSEVFKTSEVNKLFDLLCEKRCLIILDNLEVIFTPQKVAGHYQPEYEDSKNFFQLITETNHQSCLILISQEQCQEMISLDDELYPIRCLELSGLNNIDILNNLLISDESMGINLIKLYEGNPRYLQEILLLIKLFFAGNLAEFLAENEIILTENIKNQLDLIWFRLSEIEQKLLLEISQQDLPISREDIKQILQLSSIELIKGLQSLKQRFLLNYSNHNKNLFIMSSIWKQYLTQI
jgi:hypothetical protein